VRARLVCFWRGELGARRQLSRYDGKDWHVRSSRSKVGGLTICIDQICLRLDRFHA
jgi:hypothetical protein